MRTSVRTAERQERRFFTRPIGESGSPPALVHRDALYRRLLATADLLSAGVAVWVCVVGLGEDLLQPATVAALPIVVVVSKVIGLYDRDELTLHKATLDEAPALFQLATLYTLLFWLLEDVLIRGHLGDTQVLALWAALFGSLLAGRTAARRLARALAPVERCLALGDRETCRRIEAKLAATHGVKARLVACLPLDGDAGDGGLAADLSFGRLADFRTLVERLQIERLIVAPAADSEAILESIHMAKALGLKVSILPRLLEVVGSSVEFDELQGVPVLGVPRFGLSRSSRAVKQAFDYAVALGMAIALAPVLVLIALAIRLESRGPVLFRQTRVGRDGRRFQMLKFRTMVNGADSLKEGLRPLNEADGLFKIADDPRVTRVGRILRRTALDELPQLFNVLHGEMSLVGPRPLVVEEDRQVVGWHRRRLQLTPGMTGRWQILGSARIPLHEMVRIDYLYVANWSLWEDIKILLRTLPFMLAGRGM